MPSEDSGMSKNPVNKADLAVGLTVIVGIIVIVVLVTADVGLGILYGLVPFVKWAG